MEVTILLTTIIFLLVLLIVLHVVSQSRTSRISSELKELLQITNHNYEEYLRKEFKDYRDQDDRHRELGQEKIRQQLSDFGENNGRLLGAFQQQLQNLNDDIKKRFFEFHQSTDKSLRDIRLEIQNRLDHIQKDNSQQLEKIRVTVDEKLHKTLEERLGQSFQLVSESLEKVQKGLGEMKNLAHGVGDLKKVLSNVKSRGVLGEIQLGNILDQLLTPDQYALNVATIPNSRNHVEFAIKFPGKENDDLPVWLPIDSKFPMDRYQVLIDAYDNGTPEEIDRAQSALIRTVKLMAKDIQTKYIEPPHTTDFGVLFLPVEGLYAEVVRDPGLMEYLQRKHRILVAGPTNLAAFLNSLQLGFRSLAIEKRSSEVWKILGAVKSEFRKFGDVLAKTRKKLQEASNVIDKADVRTRAIEKKLRSVEELPHKDRPELNNS
ncbi:MAG: DNA recombination protein RmuC [Saprospiraceae bacterium]|nr:DNA recombination protein RmuC [Saprospiraceae bacterium]